MSVSVESTADQPTRKPRHPRYGWMVICENLFKDLDFARLSRDERVAYIDGLAESALAGIARPVDGPGEYGGCGVALRQRRTWPLRTRLSIYERDGNACLHCGASGPLQLDHIMPLARGGSDTIANLQTLCGPCNRRKWAHV